MEEPDRSGIPKYLQRIHDECPEMYFEHLIHNTLKSNRGVVRPKGMTRNSTREMRNLSLIMSLVC
jgi:hypothetical protein